MRILADAETALEEVERDINKLSSHELREAIRAWIEAQRKAIKDLRKRIN